MSGDKWIAYKCPRYDEKKQRQAELDDMAVYYDNQREYIIVPDYTCDKCWGGLNCKGITQGKTCVIVIDNKQTNWKKHRRLTQKLMKAIHRQKERDKRKEAAEAARKEREERILCGWSDFTGFCMEMLGEEEFNDTRAED